MFLFFRNILPFKYKSFCILIFVVPLTFQSLTASDSLRFINNLKIGLEMNYGYVYPHSSSIRYEVNENIYGFKLTISTNSYGRTIWDRLYRYPQYGIGILTTTLGNMEIFGRASAIYVYTDLPFTSKEKKLKFSYQFDFGLAYLSKKFDIDDNSLNVAISSHLNVYGAFGLNVRYRFDPKSEIKASLNTSHFSNGKLNTPNLGINSVKLCLAYLYTIRPARYSKQAPAQPKKIKRHNLDLVFSGGSKTDDQLTGKRYTISSFLIDYRYNLSAKYSPGIGIDALYDESLGPNKAASEGGTYSRSDMFQLACHGSFYIQFSKLTTVIQVGSYVYANYYQYSRVFSRIGFRYLLYRNIFINLSLKSHYAIADFVEWGLGYRF